MSKKCTLCRVKTDNFGPNKMTSDGLESQCRDCKNIYYKKYSKSKQGLVANPFRRKLTTEEVQDLYNQGN